MSCRRRDGQLTRWERITLAVHLLICAGCRVMEKQFAIIDSAARHLGLRDAADRSDSTNDKLSVEASAKIKNMIQ